MLFIGQKKFDFFESYRWFFILHHHKPKYNTFQTSYNTKMSISTSTIVDLAVKKLTDSYDLDKEFVASVKSSLEASLSKYFIYDTAQKSSSDADASGSAKGKKQAVATPAKEKVPRPKTAYNHFVADKMATFKDVPHQERMTKIGALWKTISAEEKAKYEAMSEAGKKATDTASTTA